MEREREVTWLCIQGDKKREGRALLLMVATVGFGKQGTDRETCSPSVWGILRIMSYGIQWELLRCQSLLNYGWKGSFRFLIITLHCQESHRYHALAGLNMAVALARSFTGLYHPFGANLNMDKACGIVTGWIWESWNFHSNCTCTSWYVPSSMADHDRMLKRKYYATSKAWMVWILFLKR